MTSTVLKASRDILRSEKTIIFLKKTGSPDLVPAASTGAGNITVSIPPSQPLIKHLQHTPGPLVKDELTLQREQEQDRWHLDEMDAVATAFVWLDIAVAVPLYVNNQLTGLIALGDKLSGTPYLQDDLNFLSALAPQAVN